MRNNHSVSNLTVHLVFVTKYRYSVLKWDLQKRTREILKQICDSNDIRIIKWVVSKDHIHLHVEYPPKISIWDLMKRLNAPWKKCPWGKLVQEN
jgi:putative transposase